MKTHRHTEPLSSVLSNVCVQTLLVASSIERKSSVIDNSHTNTDIVTHQHIKRQIYEHCNLSKVLGPDFYGDPQICQVHENDTCWLDTV